MPAQTHKDLAQDLLEAELSRLGHPEFSYILCFSDTAWREAMAHLGCPAYIARMASPTTRRSTRGKLGMATICHFKHGHDGVVYVRTHGRSWDEISETVRHEALHLARPGISHRQIHRELHSEDLPARPKHRRRTTAATRR